MIVIVRSFSIGRPLRILFVRVALTGTQCCVPVASESVNEVIDTAATSKSRRTEAQRCKQHNHECVESLSRCAIPPIYRSEETRVEAEAIGAGERAPQRKFRNHLSTPPSAAKRGKTRNLEGHRKGFLSLPGKSVEHLSATPLS
jgi:hypothetical protein